MPNQSFHTVFIVGEPCFNGVGFIAALGNKLLPVNGNIYKVRADKRRRSQCIQKALDRVHAHKTRQRFFSGIGRDSHASIRKKLAFRNYHRRITRAAVMMRNRRFAVDLPHHDIVVIVYRAEQGWVYFDMKLDRTIQIKGRTVKKVVHNGILNAHETFLRPLKRFGKRAVRSHNATFVRHAHRMIVGRVQPVRIVFRHPQALCSYHRPLPNAFRIDRHRAARRTLTLQAEINGETVNTRLLYDLGNRLFQIDGHQPFVSICLQRVIREHTPISREKRADCWI